MSGGGKTQTSTSQVSVPPEVLARYNAVNAQAESVAGTPFQPYSSDPNAFVAPMTGTQNQAINQIANASTMAQPWFNMAGGATMAGMGPANLGELDTQKYMNPYTQYVVQNTADILGQQNQEAMSRSLGTAIQSGAGWGDRSGIAAANLARQQQMALGSTIGNLYNQGYTQAQNVAQQQQGAQLEAQQANLERLLRGGSQLGQLGSGLQGTALAGGQALLGAGTQEQQTNQAGLSALYNQFKEGRAYPFQVAQFLSNIAMGTGALSGSTTTTTQPRPFFGLFNKGGRVGGGEGYRRGGLVPESMGGHVASEHSGEGYADGGMPMDYSSMVMQQLFGGMNPSAGAYGQGNAGIGVGLGYVPQANLPVGELKVAQTPEAAQSSDLVGKAGDVVDLADKATKMWEKFGPKPSVDPKVFENLNNREGDVANLLASARGGAIRPGLAAGGMPYDATTNGYVPDNTPKQPPELVQAKTPADTNSGGLGDFVKLAMMFMPKAGGGAAGGGHIVSKGETLTRIAQQYGKSLDEILEANPELRKNPDLIQIGQRVMLPQDRQAAGTPFPPKPSDFPARPGLAGAMPAARFEAQGVRPGVVGLMPRADVALPANYEFPTAGFGQERYPGSYMSDRGQKNLMDLLKLEAMRREGNYASGGTAGRSGYLGGGFASDAALAELARKKKEQDILNELRGSDWSKAGLGSTDQAAPGMGTESPGLAVAAGTPTAGYNLRTAAGTPTAPYDLRMPAGMTSEMLSSSNYSVPERLSKNMPVSPAEMRELYAQQGQSPALPGLVPSASTDEIRILATKRPPNIDASGFQNTVSGIGDVFRSGLVGAGNALTGANLAGEVMNVLEAQGLQTRKPATGWNDFMLRPSEIAKRDRDLAITDPIVNWYRDNADLFQGRPELMSEMLKDPIAYYNTHKGIAATGPASAGSVSYMGGLSAPDASSSALSNPAITALTAPTLSGGTLGDAVVTPPSVAPAVSPVAASGDGLFLGSDKAAEPATPAATEEGAGGLYLGAPAQSAAPTVTADLPMPPPKGGVVPAAATDAASAAAAEAKGGFDMFADAFTRNEGSAINPNDPNGGTRWGFNADQYGKPLTEATKEDAIALGKKWWDAQGGDEIERKYGSAFAAAYVDLSLIAPAWARSALEEANGDPAKFFENFKAKLASGKKWETYGKGWTNRINRDAAMAAGTAPVPADEGAGTDIAPVGSRTLGDARVAPSETAPAGSPRMGGDKTPSGGLAGDGDFWKQALGTEEGPGNVILPILVGLGKMISSRSPTLGGALIEGVGGGAEALMNRQSQLTNIAQQRAVTRGQNLLNVRNSIQTTANGDIVWTMQNGQPVPMYLGPYQALVGQGKYIQPLGYVPSGGQAEAALSQLGTQPIGGTEQPKVETGMPSFDANSEKLATDRGLSSEMTDTLNNDMRTLISSNTQYRESQKKISDEVEAGIVSDGLAAGGQSAFLNQLTSLLLNQPQDGVLVGGPLKELTSQAIGLWNNVAKFNPALRDYMISEEDIASGAAINKLQAAGSLGSTSKLGENTRQALDLALMTIPGNELPVEAVRKILAGLYVDKQRATDMEDALNAAKTYVAQMSPGMPGAYLAQNIAREFNSGDAAQRYATEKAQLEKVFALPFKVKEGVYVPVVDLLLKGVTMPDGSVMRITPEVFDATYGGGLNISRHILNASR